MVGSLRRRIVPKDVPKSTAALMERKKEIEAGREELRGWLKELLLYLFWLVSFLGVIFLTRESVTIYDYTNLWRRAVSSEFGDTDGSFTVDHFWSFVEGPILSLFSADTFTAATNDTTHYLYGNRLVGSLRLRQLRVKQVECGRMSRIVMKSFNSSVKCYPEWCSSGCETTDWSKQGAPDGSSYFKHKTATELRELPFYARYSIYPGGGFVADLFNSSEATATVKALQRLLWVDLQTRAVFVDFTFFNENLGIFIVARTVSEFLPSGVVRPHYTFRTLVMDRYPMDSASNFIVIGLEGIVVAFVLWYFFEEVVEIREQGWRKYFSQMWNAVDILNLLLFFGVIFLHIRTTLTASYIMDNLRTVSTSDLQTVGFLMQQETNLTGVNAALMCIKLFKYIRITQRLTRLSRTISRSAKDTLTYGGILFIFISGFAVMGFLVFGSEVEDFMNYSSSLTSLLRVLFGDFDYSSLHAANRLLGAPFLFIYLFVASIILINVFVAIMCEVYASVCTEEIDEDTILSRCKAAVLGKLERYKLINRKQTINDLISRLSHGGTDENNDGEIDRSELATFLASESGLSLEIFDAATVDDVMKKFDKDGGGTLDADEMASLREYLEEKRRVNETEIAKVDEEITDEVPASYPDHTPELIGLRVQMVRLERRMDLLAQSLTRFVQRPTNIPASGGLVDATSLGTLPRLPAPLAIRSKLRRTLDSGS